VLITIPALATAQECLTLRQKVRSPGRRAGCAEVLCKTGTVGGLFIVSCPRSRAVTRVVAAPDQGKKEKLPHGCRAEARKTRLLLLFADQGLGTANPRHPMAVFSAHVVDSSSGFCEEPPSFSLPSRGRKYPARAVSFQIW